MELSIVLILLILIIFIALLLLRQSGLFPKHEPELSSVSANTTPL